MRFAFAIVSLFPGGGLQRDCVDIARAIARLGHEVTIFASRIRDADFAHDLDIVVIPNDAKTNHTRQRLFGRDVLRATKDKYDLLVGFDKMYELDVLYCADQSVVTRMRKNIFFALLTRYRAFMSLERASFGRNNATRIFLLSSAQLREYAVAWKTPSERLHLINPTLPPERRRPELRSDGTAARVREMLGARANDWIWLSVMVQPETKGLDRIVRALSEFPDAVLVVAGLSAGDRAARDCLAMATQQGVDNRIKWLGHREDIPELMAAADLLLHPARYDTTGTAILEAIVNGLPVITTSACGYAAHVDASQGGLVLPQPFRQTMFVAALQQARDENLRRMWSRSAEEYGRNTLFYHGRDQIAADFVRLAEENKRKVTRSTSTR
jgi:UDP-glucose:(heptosyl)LPS alpha-1,3-glucosyltransferase